MPETGIRYDQHQRIIDGNGKILVTNPSDPATGGYVTENQLKEWIEDVLAYPSVSQFPSTGEDGRLYIAKNTNTLYRWTGTQYVQLTADISGKEDKSNKVTSITPASTDEQYPSAKAVYEETARLEEPIKEISTDLGELESRVSTLEDRTDTVESDIITLKGATDSLDTRLQDLETEVSQQNLRITNLEYENRIVKAVIKKKIAEETEMTGSVIQFPTSEGYPLADWGELKRLRGESLVWNQLVPQTSQSGSSSRTDNIPIRLSVRAYSGSSYQNLYNGSVSKGSFEVISKLSENTTEVRILHDGNSANISIMAFAVSIPSSHVCMTRVMFDSVDTSVVGGIAWSSASLTDLTTLFGVTEVSAVTDAMKAWVRTYAEAHPQYDAGSLVSAVYESGVSKGRNVIPTEGWVVGAIDNTTGANNTDNSVCRSDYIPIEGNPQTFYLTSVNNIYIWIHFYDSSRQWISGKALYPWIGGTSSSYYASVPSNAKYIRVRTTANYGKTYNGDICVSELKEDGVIPHSSQTLDLSFLNSVPDIGIEGTVIDFEKQSVTWRCNKVVFNGTEGFNATSSYVYCTKLVAKGLLIPPYYRMNHKNSVNADLVWYDESATIVQFNQINKYAGVTDNTDTIGFKAYLKDHPLELVYELATPVTKTFADLGIVIPPSWDGGKPWIRVEAGGTFTVVSSGAPAEATVSFLTNLGGNA